MSLAVDIDEAQGKRDHLAGSPPGAKLALSVTTKSIAIIAQIRRSAK